MLQRDDVQAVRSLACHSAVRMVRVTQQTALTHRMRAPLEELMIDSLDAVLPSDSLCRRCQDSQQCLSGQASGPTVGPTCSIWSWLSCSAAAQCAAIPDCSNCLMNQFEGQQCGFCATSGRCSAGDQNGPFAAAATTCPNTAPNAWRWNAFESSYLQCYQQLTYTVQQPAFTTTDQMSFALLCATILLAVFLTIGFSGCCRVCHRWAPKAGEARTQEAEAIAEHADDDDPRRHYLDRECCGLCCGDSLNTQCARLWFWCLNCVLIVLIVAAMGLDSWSMVSQQISLVSSEDNPVTTIEGTLLVSVALGGSARRNTQSYSYDCSDPQASNAAQSECAVHYDAGVVTLILGIGAALAAFINFLIASSDLCCSAKAKRAGAVDGAVRGGGGGGLGGGQSDATIDLILAHKIRYPYSSLQWRLAVLTCIACLISCAFWLCGSWILSQQYLSGLQLGPSFQLMSAAWILAVLLAVMYRRAIRVTPREGYPLDSEADGLVFRRKGVQNGDGRSRSASFTASAYLPPHIDAAQGYAPGAAGAVDISTARLGQPTPSGSGSDSAGAFSYQSFTSQQAFGSPAQQAQGQQGSLSQPLLSSGSLSSSPQHSGKIITRSSFRGPLSPIAQQQLHQEEQQRIAQQQQVSAPCSQSAQYFFSFFARSLCLVRSEAGVTTLTRFACSVALFFFFCVSLSSAIRSLSDDAALRLSLSATAAAPICRCCRCLWRLPSNPAHLRPPARLRARACRARCGCGSVRCAAVCDSADEHSECSRRAESSKQTLLPWHVWSEPINQRAAAWTAFILAWSTCCHHRRAARRCFCCLCWSDCRGGQSRLSASHSRMDHSHAALSASPQFLASFWNRDLARTVGDEDVVHRTARSDAARRLKRQLATEHALRNYLF